MEKVSSLHGKEELFMTEKDYEQVKNAFDSYYQSYQDISDDIRHEV